MPHVAVTSKFLILLALGTAPPASTPTPEGVVQTKIDAAIRRLQHGSFEVRQLATQDLWSLGPAAIPALRRAAESQHAEVRLRADRILERFRFGIFADTPEHEVGLINAFRTGDSRTRDAAFRQLARVGHPDTLLRLLETESNDRLRSQFQDHILRRLETDLEIERALELAEQWLNESSQNAGRQKSLGQFVARQVPYLLATERKEQAESILERAASTEQGMRNWAVYLTIDGRADATLAALRSGPENPITLSQQAYLLRAQGDLDGAREVAAQLEEVFNPLLWGILFELRDWRALSDQHLTFANEDHFGYARNIEAVAYGAAFHRLAGETELFANAVQLLETPVDRRAAEPGVRARRGEALLVNGLVDEAIKVLSHEPAKAFRLLCIQNKYQRAFQIVPGLGEPRGDHRQWFAKVAQEAGSRSSKSDSFDLALHVAKVLYQLGEHKPAQNYLQTLADSVAHQQDAARLSEICEAESQLGLVDQAFEHAALGLANGRTAVLTRLFPASRRALDWWKFLRATAAHETPIKSSLSELRQLLGRPGFDSDRFQQLVRRADEYAAKLPESRRADWLYAVGQLCWKYDQPDLAESFYARAADGVQDAAVQLGDICYRRQAWLPAAQWYERAWQQDRTQAISLYLKGLSLSKTDRQDESRRLIHVAQLVPLADSSRRLELARGLQQRGLQVEAAEQWQLIMRSGHFRGRLDKQFSDTALVDAEKLFANLLTDDLLLKADYWQSMHLSCLEWRLHIPSLRGYLHTPHLIHKTRARAFLAAGDFERAGSEIKQSQRLLPGNIELAEHLVPALEHAGQQAAADRLFEDSFAFTQQICTQFPNSALHHNNLAWMSARCNRRLDEALVHAKRALDLAPANPSYLDTLGEVHFRRGEVADAIRCARRCLELDPSNNFFQAQLKRYQQAE